MSSPNFEIEGVERARDDALCSSYIYLWAKLWKVRKKIAAPLAMAVVLATRLEIIGPIVRTPIAFLAKKLEPLIGPTARALPAMTEWVLGTAAIAMVIQHQLLRRAIDRHQSLLDSLRQVTWMSTSKGEDFTDFITSILHVLKGSASHTSGLRRVFSDWQQRTAAGLGDTRASNGVIGLSGEVPKPIDHTRCAIFKVTSNTLEKILSVPHDDKRFELTLPLDGSIVGYSAQNRTAIYLPAMKWKRGVALTKKSPLGRSSEKDWCLSVLEGIIPVFLPRREAEAAGFKSVLCCPIIKATGPVWGVLVLVQNETSACKMFHFDTIDIASHLIAAGVDRLDGILNNEMQTPQLGAGLEQAVNTSANGGSSSA